MVEHRGSLLRLEGVWAGYGPTMILEDITLTLSPGAAVALLGRNGVGKTTLLATIMGHTTLYRGAIDFCGDDISREPPFRRSWRGLGFVPQTRRIFSSLTVAENLNVAARPGRWTMEAIYELFPRLAERRRNFGNHLSGGEQQMLAIGRALIGNPSLILMDEPFEGLAPVIIEQLADVLRSLRQAGEPAVLLVEQYARLALDLTDDVMVLDRGRVVHKGGSRALLDDTARFGSLLGIAAESSGQI